MKEFIEGWPIVEEERVNGILVSSLSSFYLDLYKAIEKVEKANKDVATHVIILKLLEIFFSVPYGYFEQIGKVENFKPAMFAEVEHFIELSKTFEKKEENNG